MTVMTEFVSDLGWHPFLLEATGPKNQNRLGIQQLCQLAPRTSAPVPGGRSDRHSDSSRWLQRQPMRLYGRHDDGRNGWPDRSFRCHCHWVCLQEKFPSLDDLLSKRHRAPASGAVPPAVQTDVAHRCRRWRQPSGLVMLLGGDVRYCR